MTISWAIEQLLNGRKVYRANSPVQGVYWILHKPHRQDLPNPAMTEPSVHLFERGALSTDSVGFRESDLLATDWVAMD